ncbi:store-operated calcium entry regulator STIMATE-like [Amphiura filiformis]|uniref:store-operated calcium entry regulator STIMATE-like n=1 Tax=Amphiura filiformis TaxID=82378 RepID=UPI003B2192C5
MTSENSNSVIMMNKTETEEIDHCSQGALTTRFGILIQGILAFLAFCSLIVKRLREPKEHRRSWRIWFYDTSKQALGASVIHFANVFLSDIFQGDPCTWYIVYFLLDSTVGLLIIYIGIRLSQLIVSCFGCKTLYFGEYGTPPQCEAWIGQCAVFVLIVLLEKVLITFLAKVKIWEEVAVFILTPINNVRVEVVIVMLIVPFIINAIMFWVVDNFLMKKKQTLTTKIPSPSGIKSKVRYTRNIPKGSSDTGEGSESEVLISPDEDEKQTTNPTTRLLNSSD